MTLKYFLIKNNLKHYILLSTKKCYYDIKQREFIGCNKETLFSAPFILLSVENWSLGPILQYPSDKISRNSQDSLCNSEDFYFRI